MVVKNGQTVSVHYVGVLEDGTEFDNSRSRGEPFSVNVGTGQVIPGFDQALEGMEVGEVKNISLTPDQAYGPERPEAIQEVPRNSFPAGMQLQEGMPVQGNGPAGPVMATIQSFDEANVVVDLNHPLAGKTLNFEIELISIS